MKHILVIDDDQATHLKVKAALGGEYEIFSCLDLKEAEEILSKREDISLALIDRMLPDGDGLLLCQKIRADDRLKQIPIIFLSGLTSESDKVSGLFAGADDYISKPFGGLELRARIQARLRTQTKTLVASRVELDLGTHRAFVNDPNGKREIILTRTEFKILTSLLQAMGQVLSRETLLQKVWGDHCNVNDRVIDTHISHLRKKIEGSGLSLQSSRGEGYRLDYEATREPISA